MEKMPTYLIDALVIVSICEQLPQKLEAKADEIERIQTRNENLFRLQREDNGIERIRARIFREVAMFIRDQYNQIDIDEKQCPPDSSTPQQQS